LEAMTAEDYEKLKILSKPPSWSLGQL